VDLRRLNRGELIAAGGGILLAISIFLPWYSLGNSFAHAGSCHNSVGHVNTTCSAWNALTVLPYLFLLGAIAPVVLAWIIARGHALAWPRGELTAVVAIVALILALFVGVIDKPGSPPGQISVSCGWGVALVGCLLMLAGAVWRSQESAPRRKPPGVL
jgi:hypothetical protein